MNHFYEPQNDGKELKLDLNFQRSFDLDRWYNLLKIPMLISKIITFNIIWKNVCT